MCVGYLHPSTIPLALYYFLLQVQSMGPCVCDQGALLLLIPDSHHMDFSMAVPTSPLLPDPQPHPCPVLFLTQAFPEAAPQCRHHFLNFCWLRALSYQSGIFLSVCALQLNLGLTSALLERCARLARAGRAVL